MGRWETMDGVDAPTHTPLTQILFLCANPSDTPRIEFAEEYRAIKTRLRESEHRDRFALVFEPCLRADGIAPALLEHRPALLHFSGHGQSDEVVLSNSEGRAAPVRWSDVAAILRSLPTRDEVRCVVLNACHSDDAAGALSAHVDCVIGTPAELPDGAAIAFSGAFYGALGFGLDVASAYDAACAELRAAAPTSPVAPQLHVRPQIDAAAVRFVEDWLAPSGPPRRVVFTDTTSDATAWYLFAHAASIGRSRDCDFSFPLAPPDVGRRHAELTFDPRSVSYRVRDLGARGGVFVNDRRVEAEATLHRGDRVRLGAALRFVFEATRGQPLGALRWDDDAAFARYSLVPGTEAPLVLPDLAPLRGRVPAAVITRRGATDLRVRADGTTTPLSSGAVLDLGGRAWRVEVTP